MRTFSSLVFICLITGCGPAALEPVHVRLAPSVPIVSVDIGRGAKLFLRVADARPEKIAVAQNKANALILPVNDVVSLFHELLTKRLSALGFELLIAPDALSTRLDVALQKLAYGRYSTTPPRVHIDASLTVALYKNNTRVIDKNYSKTYEEVSPSMGLSPSWFEDKTNTVLSQLIEKLLSDLELLAALK